MATFQREDYVAACQRKAEIEALMNWDAHFGKGAPTTGTPSMLNKKETAARFGVSVSKFDQDRKSNGNGNRNIHLDPVPGMGRRVLFHSEKVEAEVERHKKRRQRE